MFGDVPNIIGDVSGWTRRIKNIFIIFEKKYFPNIFFQKNPKKKGKVGADPPLGGRGNGSRLRPYFSPLGAPLQSEKWPHGEKMSIFQTLLYFHHNVTTGKGTSY